MADKQEGEFLQWFATYDEAVEAIDDFTKIIKRDRKYKGCIVSRPRKTGKGFALYAIPRPK
jgi:predicted glycosyltransferase